MSLLIVILVVILVLCLVLWAVHYIPFPPGTPDFLKPMLMVVCILVAALVILAKSGVVAM